MSDLDKEMTAPDVEEGEAFVPENPDEVPAGDSVAMNAAYEAVINTDWYGQLLKRSNFKLGNNKRLKKVIDRVGSGETVTFVTIGGSITEGAGAAKYEECYAYQACKKFTETFCAGNEDKVLFLNAGVGGTPSVFGDMRYKRDVLDCVSEKDTDGLPDVVIIEFAVNDWQEPTDHRCYESLVKDILSAPNEPAVILLFAVFPSKFTLQTELAPVGEKYDLMMVSISDSCMPLIGDEEDKKWTEKEFFFDIYHPTTLGHLIMSDCILSTMKASLAEKEPENDIDLLVSPAYGTDYCGIKTIYKRDALADDAFDIGSFTSNDPNCFRNFPLGMMWEDTFFHDKADGSASMKFSLNCKNMLIAYRSVNDEEYGSVEILMDGEVIKTINGNTGSWGQSVPDVVFNDGVSKKRDFEIRMVKGDEAKKFTITCLSYTE